MASDLKTALIGAAAGLLSGGVSSVVAPWVNWRLAEKKALRERREKLIGDARGLLATFSPMPRLFPARLQQEPAYLAIRPNLDPVARDTLEAGGSHGQLSMTDLRAAVDALESTWGLS